MKIRNAAAAAAILALVAAPLAIAQESDHSAHGQPAQAQSGKGHMMGQGHMMMGGNMAQMREMMDEMSKMMAQMRDMMAAAEQGEQGGHDMSAMGQVKGDQGPASKAYAEANAKMHGAMDIEYSSDADVDFAKGMIAHHQGAIDMAEIVLRYGKDEEMRKLAQQIIAAQEPEIAFMKEWLARNGK